jgi:hypothetical protein
MATARTGTAIQRAERFALEQSLGRVAKVVFPVIAILAVLGTFERLDWGFSLFDFDGEGKPLAIWSASVLFAAAAAAGLVSRHDTHRRRWLVLGGFFTFMGFDELLTIHEHVSDAVGVGWLTLFFPLMIAGGVAWLLVAVRVWRWQRERVLMVAGAAAWFVSQYLEKVQSTENGRVRGYGALSGAEEILEVTGSTLFLLAMLGTLHVLARRERDAA